MRTSPVIYALGAALAACGRGPSAADTPPEPWVRFLDNGRIAAAVDTASLRRDTAGVRVRLRFDYPEPQPVPGGAGGATFTRSEVREEVDCRGRRVRDFRLDLFDAAGKPAGSYDFQAAGAPWQTFDAHGMTVHLFGPLCEYLAGARRAA